MFSFTYNFTLSHRGFVSLYICFQSSVLVESCYLDLPVFLSASFSHPQSGCGNNTSGGFCEDQVHCDMQSTQDTA